MRSIFPLVAVFGACAFAVPGARAAVPADFAKKMTLTPSATVLETIGESIFENFPVLVRLPAEASAELMSADGTDLFFTDENDASLSFEVDTFNPAGETLVWVKVPSFSSATVLTVYFGCMEDINNSPSAVWTNYAGVWHMNEASGTVTDATGNGLGASPAKESAVSVAHAAGAVGTARQTATSDVKDYLTIPNYNSLGVGGNFTFSCFYDATARKGYDRLVSRKDTHDAGNGWEVEMANASNKLSARGASATSISGTFSDLVSSGWMRFTFVYSGTTLIAYLDGAQIGTGTITAATDNGYPLSIGCDSDGSEAYFVGYVDEARLRKGAASAAEVALEYATMSDAAFFDLGAIESVDDTAQVFETPTIARNANGTYTVTVVLSENSGDVGVIYDAGETAITNILATAANPGTYTDTPDDLTANTTYKFAAYGKNANGTEAVKKGGVFYNGDISIEKISDANENGLVTGVFRISRADTAHDLTVTYTVGGTATAGQTYTALSGTATIPAGSTSVNVEVVPLIDAQTTEDKTVALTLNAGLYGIDAQAGSAEMTVVNLSVPEGFNVWVATEDGLASVGSNWSTGIAPTASDNVLFDGRFSTANCEWDAAATHTVATWTQTADYAGTVTFDTKYPVTGDAFQTFTVTGACVVDGGVWTHPVSVSRPNNGTALTVGQLRDAYTYRLSVAAGSFTIGSGARIDAIGKGLSQKRVSANVAQLNPAHGGKSGDSTVACYGNPKYPEDIGYASNMGTDGLGKCAAGGGAVKIAVTGACVVNGVITVDGERSSGNVAAGAAGSVLIEAASVSGTGSIFARAVWCGNNSYANGVGGRIALITVDPVDTTSLTVSAGAASDIAAASGTVYLKDASMTDGVLIVRNTGRTTSNPARDRRTDVSSDGVWKFDRLELGGDVQFAVPFGTTLTLPGGNCVSAPYNSSGTPSGLYYLGGALDFGSSSEVTLSGKWYFAPISNYVFNANVSLADGAAIGFGGKFPQRLANNAYPVSVDRIHCTVEGDLTVPSGCSVNVNQSGAMQDSHYIPSGYPQEAHGGRRSNTMATIGSVFHPRTLPHGQSNSYGHIIPGGAVELSVSGTFTLGGTVTSTGYEGGDGIVSQSAGGSIDISAGRLVGTGTITAGAIKNGQPGGRIAIRLTAAGATLGDFDGTVNCATMGAGSVGSCGSIYIETAADGDRRGTIILDDNNVTCTTYTPICATGYEADDVADFKKASLVIKRQAKGQVTAADAEGRFAMNSVEIDSTGQLDLFGHTLIVKSAKVNGVKLAPGTYTAESTVEIVEGTLADYLVDTATGGELVVTGGGFSIIVR